MSPRRFNISVSLSTLLLAITLTLWPLSCYYESYLQLYPNPSTGIGSSHGNLWLFRETAFQWGDLHRRYWFIFFTLEKRDFIPYDIGASEAASFHIALDRRALFDVGTQGTKLKFPYWFLTLLFTPLPLAWLIQFLRRPPKSGLCQKCGYDLRASIDRCPECGTPFPKNFQH